MLWKNQKYLLCERWRCSWSQYNNQVVQEFHSGCKSLNDQAKSDEPKIMDSWAVLQILEANLESSTWRMSGKLGISVQCGSSSLWSELLNCVSHYENISKSLTCPNIIIVYFLWGFLLVKSKLRPASEVFKCNIYLTCLCVCIFLWNNIEKYLVNDIFKTVI